MDIYLCISRILVMKKIALPLFIVTSLLTCAQAAQATTLCPQPEQIREKLLSMLTDGGIALKPNTDGSYTAFGGAPLKENSINWSFAANLSSPEIKDQNSAFAFLQKELTNMSQVSQWNNNNIYLCDYDTAASPETRTNWLQLQFNASHS